MVSKKFAGTTSLRQTMEHSQTVCLLFLGFPEHSVIYLWFEVECAFYPTAKKEGYDIRVFVCIFFCNTMQSSGY